MVEFFVVALILGVGLLGLAALTAISVRGFGGSRARDAAVTLADSVLDRLTLDGRMSSALRGNGQAIPASALLANASDGTSNAYADPQTGFTNYDLQGLPTNTTPVFVVTWVRLAPKSAMVSQSTSNFAASEVVVNVSWNEAVKNVNTGASTAQARSISVNRYISY